MKIWALPLALVAVAACSGSTTIASLDDAGTATNEEDAAVVDGASPGDATVVVVDASTPSGVGSCSAPVTITLPFSTDAAASTATASDQTALSCGAPSGLAEAVYRVDVTQRATLSIVANDSSGQGVGVGVFSGSCTGASAFCRWESNGDLHDSVTLEPGTYYVVVERKPAGKFKLSFG